MPMITIFSWLETWLTLPENCLVMFKNGTTMLMPKAMPERLRLGAPVIIITPETMATHTYSTLPMLFRMGISMLA